jgi:hypothetical protein
LSIKLEQAGNIAGSSVERPFGRLQLQHSLMVFRCRRAWPLRGICVALPSRLRTYRRWERGERHRDNLYGVFKFCENYGLDYAWLFGGLEHGDPPRFRLRLVS